jgi:hypothetical protein
MLLPIHTWLMINNNTLGIFCVTIIHSTNPLNSLFFDISKSSSLIPDREYSTILIIFIMLV